MNSLWKATAEIPRFPSLKRDIKTDVLIIGGGMAGILTAYLLEQQGVNYCLVEGGRIANATTANTTAKITAQHGAIYAELLNKIGAENARKYLEINLKAVDLIKQIATDCDLEQKDNYVYSKTDRKKLENEILALEKIGFKAELCDSVPLPLRTVGAVKFTNQAQFHPLKFIRTISKNLKIYENTFVKEVKDGIAYTDINTIKAQKIIVATHFPFINRHGNYFLKLYQHRSYVTALKYAQNVDGMYVDEAKNGLSFRNYKDLLLLGGGDHRTGKQGGGLGELRRFAKNNYSKAREIYTFAAQDCMSLDSLAYIGKYSAFCSELYVATGFNKWGMTGSAVSAMLLCDMILGKNNEYASVFSPSRSILKPQLAVNGFETITNILNFKTPRCTHLGCALKWNKQEHSWDCTCHGSRFSEDGKVLENPAMKNLED
ncbi:MAG: FAD-dependent oxidoreductase [Clostridia bacterium]|nr:FAD-dependent oxidoreductase [Clostridia bacterium]